MRNGKVTDVREARALEPHGPRTYTVGIRETLYKEVRVSADDVDSAIEAASEMYYNDEVELDAEDLADTDFEFVSMEPGKD